MKKTLGVWWGRRNPRERLIVQGAALVAVAALGYQVAIAPERAATRKVRAELAGAQSELDRIHASIEEQARRNESEIQSRRSALAQRRDAAEEVIRAAQTDLVTPRQMPRQLGAILDRFPQMRVVAMTTLAPVPVTGNAGSPGNAADPSGAAGPRPAASASGAASGNGIGLYQHGMQVTVSGRYLDLIGYLQALEHAPYRVYWRQLDLKVDEKGMPVTRIDIFTLSRETTWLAL